MKKITILAMMLMISVFVYAQKSETRSLGSFDEISVGESVKVTLVKGSSEKAEIEVTGADLDDVETNISGGKLVIGMANGSYRNVKVTATITYTNLESLSVSSSAKVTAKDKINANKFKLSVSSSGYADINLDANDVVVKVSSSGDAIINGNAKALDVSVSSSGSLEGFGFKVEEADISVNSSGKAEVYVTNTLDARANSSGKVVYKGDPRTSISANSSGKVVKG